MSHANEHYADDLLVLHSAEPANAWQALDKLGKVDTSAYAVLQEMEGADYGNAHPPLALRIDRSRKLGKLVTQRADSEQSSPIEMTHAFKQLPVHSMEPGQGHNR